jgi:adenylate cyclase
MWRLMGADEEGTLERLKALRRELLDPKIAEHHGRLPGSSPRTKTPGDRSIATRAARRHRSRSISWISV